MLHWNRTPYLSWFWGRGVRTFALAWIYGANEPGFHLVLEDGDEFAIVPGRGQEIFQITPHGYLQVSLD